VKASEKSRKLVRSDRDARSIVEAASRVIKAGGGNKTTGEAKVEVKIDGKTYQVRDVELKR